jgi:hypothetical protein
LEKGHDLVHDGGGLTKPTMTKTAPTFELTLRPVAHRGVRSLVQAQVSAVARVAELLLGALLLLAHGAGPPF